MEYLPGKVSKNDFKQLAEGLREIHSQQVCHRDLAPTNMKLDSEGCLKYYDFGISKIML